MRNVSDPKALNGIHVGYEAGNAYRICLLSKKEVVVNLHMPVVMKLVPPREG